MTLWLPLNIHFPGSRPGHRRRICGVLSEGASWNALAGAPRQFASMPTSRTRGGRPTRNFSRMCGRPGPPSSG